MTRVLRGLGGLLLLLGVVTGVVALQRAQSGGELSCELRVKDRVISGAYKSYGSPDCIIPLWLAKTVFRNDTPGMVENLAVRYRFGEYADWSTPHLYPTLVPGQTVVDLYHPILPGRIAELTSRAPAEVQMEYSYVDGAGREHSSSASSRITILGRNEFIHNDLLADERTDSFHDWYTLTPLLAAWVSRNDPPVARLASMANKKAGGIGASENDESCVRVMRELYEIMRTIRITYQYPASLSDKGMSYDVKLVQSLQYPRDTIQKRSGTCIDLAILYAAMLHSVNIKPVLASVPGHCFPVAVLPGGGFLPIEATGVGGGGNRSMAFEDAVKSGEKTFAEHMANGKIVLTDVQECWTRGVSCPELKELPPDILEKWGIVELVEGTATRPPRSGPPQCPSTVGGGAPPGSGSGTSPPLQVGDWTFVETLPTGGTNNGTCTVAVQGNDVRVVSVISSQMVLPTDGRLHHVHGVCTYTGRIRGQTLSATCSEATTTVDGVGVPTPGLPFSFTGQISPDGRKVSGTLSGSLGTSSTVVMQAR